MVLTCIHEVCITYEPIVPSADPPRWQGWELWRLEAVLGFRPVRFARAELCGFGNQGAR